MPGPKDIVDGVENTAEEEDLTKIAGGTNDTLESVFNNGDMDDLKGDGNFNETLGVSTPNDQIAEDIEDRKSPSPFEIGTPELKPD